MNLRLFIEKIRGEKISAVASTPQAALETDLHEKHLGDFIERSGGVKMLAVADGVVALVEQVGKLVFLENFQLFDEFRDFLVGGVGVREYR